MKLNYFLSSLLVMLCIVGVFARIGRPAECCTKTGKDKAKVTEILSYVHQNNALCPVSAVRFLLINGITICSDPKDPWAKRIITILDRTTIQPSAKDTTKRISSPGITTESTVTMTTPKVTSSTWKPTTYTHRFLAKQPLGKTSGQQTTTQITTMKKTMKLTTVMDSTPLITDIKTTDMTTTMTTESPVTTTTPKETSITHTASTKKLPRITRIPQHWTSTKQSTTIMERPTVTPERKLTSMTMTTSKGTSTTWKPTAYITTKQETRVTTTTPEGTSTTWKPTAYITTKQETRVTTKTPEGTSTTWKPTAYITTKQDSRVTMKTPKRTSTTKRQVQKKSTMNVIQGRPSCPKNVTHKLDKYKNKSIPWTVRRLKKKRKQGLRRVQMNPGCIEG
ncbi:mucin-17-like isoform X2 [Tachysurus fulvidraco]|uniref:mucin-17-like isoform X2 n=1 Tax=Tachysurus fulvidraco TaxID=1234273 RepID=UPI000F510B0D|nr:mucin-17-like isoform X2 [Tachysurus fulvidraco]